VREIAEPMRDRVVGSVVLVVGVVTLDDLAARLTDAGLAARLSARITRAAMPVFDARVRVN
jgi:hypothetical protein